MCPKRHFILHASQDALSVPSRGFDYLGEALREELRPDSGADRDAAPAFIRAYALSGGSVTFTCPDTGFAGAEAAHGFLVSMSGVDQAPRATDPSYAAEASWISGRGPKPARLHRVQAVGLASAAAAAAFSPTDGASLEPQAAARAAARLHRRSASRSAPAAVDPLPGIDSTAIDNYLACPYSYLYLRLLNAGPQASGISFVDAMFIGDVYHHALARLFARIRDADGRFRPERKTEYRALVGPCLDDAFAELSRQRGPFVGIVLEAYRGKLRSYLENLVDAEASLFPDLEIGPLEMEFELEYPDVEGGVVLRGRIDRVSLSAKGAVVVDYKKGRLPSKSQVAPDDEGAIAEAQIPCYLRLVGANGAAIVAGSGASPLSIDSAWYISIEGDAHREPASAACAFGDDGASSRGEGPYVQRSSLQDFLAAFDAALRRTVEGIFAGAFPLASKETQKRACASCGARGICRERYALRFGSPSQGPVSSGPMQ